MTKFELAEMAEVNGIISFKKLVIDGKCQFDDFCEQLRHDGNLIKQLAGIMSNLNQVANLKRLPMEKFRDITPSGERIKEFEIKKNDLRVYLLKEEGHIVVIAGKKSSQDQDIPLFRSIKKRYLESKP